MFFNLNLLKSDLIPAELNSLVLKNIFYFFAVNLTQNF